MSYVYKNGSKYHYKRRIPHTTLFYSFPISSNKKKSEQIARYFTKITKVFFRHLKDSKMAQWDWEKVAKALDEYQKKALEEDSEIEKLRHFALAKLFPTTKEIFGQQETLPGGHPDVIDKALEAYEYLGLSYAEDRKPLIDVHGKALVSRATQQIKTLYQEFRNDKVNTKYLYDFLTALFKTEGEILKIDKERTVRRFSRENNFHSTLHSSPVQLPSKSRTYTEELTQNTISLKEAIDKYLFVECNYKKEDLRNSKSIATKANKIMVLIQDVFVEQSKTNIVEFDESVLKRICEVVHYVRMDKTGKGFLEVYNAQIKEIESAKASKREPNLKQIRSADTVDKNLDIMNRFLDFLFDREYISPQQKKDYTKIVVNAKNDIPKLVKKGLLQDTKTVEAFKNAMLKDIFSKESEYYKVLFECLSSKKRYTKPSGERLSTLSYWTKFYVPIILLFTGARVSEIVQIKTEDFVIDENNIAKIYIRDGKTTNAKRIIVINDFIVNELRFKTFFEIAQQQKREYLFEQEREDLVGNTFNDAIKTIIAKHYSKDDEFYNTRYSLHSLRHNFATYLSSVGGVTENLAKKIQGHAVDDINAHYLSSSVEHQDMIQKEKFHLYKQIDFTDFQALVLHLEKSFN